MSPSTITELLSKAKEFYESQRWDQAIETYLQVIEKEPKNAEALKYLMSSYEFQGDFEKVLAVAEKLKKLLGDDSQFWQRLGLTYYNCSLKSPDEECDFDLAIEALDKAIEIDPKNLHAYNAFGMVFIALKDFKKADEYFRKYIELEEDKAKGLTKVGFAFFQQDQLALAKEYLQSALEEDPNFEEANLLLQWLEKQEKS